MKSNYLLLLLIFVCMSVTDQLQRKFFDFRLGESTRNEVVRYYEKIGKQIIYRDDKIAVKNVRFGGRNVVDGNFLPFTIINYYV